jgi:hypothetical protein
LLASEVSLTLSHAPSHLKVLFAWDTQINVAILRQIHRPWVFNKGWWLSRSEVLGYVSSDPWVERWFVFVSHGLSR